MEDLDNYWNYSAEHNTWSINFLNKDKLTEPEIREIFDKFGPIRKVLLTKPSTEHGTSRCFVNFLAKSSAINCIQEMKNHHVIQLKPFRNKVEPITKNSVKSSGENSPSFRSRENFFKNSKNGLNTSTTSLASMESSCSTIKKVSPQNNKEIQSKTVDSPSDELKNQNNVHKNVQDSREIITAEEVIVANVDEGYGENFFLDLFGKYEPIAASRMKIIPNYPLRYCHIYFMTQQQAAAVEANYDNVKLDNRDLIVLRVSTLSEEAKAH